MSSFQPKFRHVQLVVNMFNRLKNKPEIAVTPNSKPVVPSDSIASQNNFMPIVAGCGVGVLLLGGISLLNRPKDDPEHSKTTLHP